MLYSWTIVFWQFVLSVQLQLQLSVRKYSGVIVANLAQWLGYLGLESAAPGSNHGSRVFFRKISDVAVLIDTTLLVQWTLKSLIKLIETIQY